jgi:anti-sigma regulatory factor (Ser/Thr protein kinase)
MVDSKRITIIVKDYGGKPFDPTFFEEIVEKKAMGVGGRGIKIIKEIMDEVMYIFRNGESTTLYMTKYKKES